MQIYILCKFFAYKFIIIRYVIHTYFSIINNAGMDISALVILCILHTFRSGFWGQNTLVFYFYLRFHIFYVYIYIVAIFILLIFLQQYTYLYSYQEYMKLPAFLNSC